MARTYHTGTVFDSGGNAVTNAASLQALLRDTLVGDGWTLVETISGSTNVIYVLKRAMADSGLSADMYLVITRAVASGLLTFYIGHAYNSSTHVLSDCLPGASGSARPVDSVANGAIASTITITFAASTGVPTISGTTYNPTLTAVASVNYDIVTDTDHVVMRLGTSSYYFGAFTSTAQVTDALPVLAHDVGTNSNSTPSSYTIGHTMTSRHPQLPSTAGYAYSHTGYDAGYYKITAGVSVTFTTGDSLQGGKPAYEVPVNHEITAGGGSYRGKFKKMRYIVGYPTGTVPGDTFSINGTTWFVFRTTGSDAIVVDTGVAG